MRGWEYICVDAEGFTGRDRLRSGPVGSSCREHPFDVVGRSIGDEFTWIGNDRGRANVLANGEGDCC